MKRNICRVLSCALVLALLPAVLCFFAFVLPSQYEHTFLGALKYKVRALENVSSPRIVIAGGSGAAFGVDSGLLETLLPEYSVVNLGMYARLGSTVPLDLAEGLLREGDIVVFMPEQSEQTLSMYFDAESMWQAADGAFSLLGRLDTDRAGAMLGAFPEFAAGKFNLWRSGVPLMPEGVYRCEAFNERGDISAGQRGGNIMPEGLDRSMMISFDEAILSEDFAQYVREYARRCEGKGVRFVYRFCPMNASALEAGAGERAAGYAEALHERLGCAVAGDVNSAIMDAGWFYDTNFHLNDAGVIVNTVNMARELAEYLGMDAELSAELPDMPPLRQTALHSGDNSDADCFLYEISEGEAKIRALSEAAQGRTKLTVPTARDGYPVVSFDASVFAGNAELCEIVVQENIRHIDDGSFDGCTALKHIVMRHEKPQDCTVGQALLRGTDAKIRVPSGSLSAYATNYFWSAHASRLYSDAERTDEPQKEETQEIPMQDAEEWIVYHGNGGVRSDGSETMRVKRSRAHLRVNTLQGTRYFTREGYVLSAWNTEADGSGVSVSLGSRIQWQEGLTLYAQWVRTDPEEHFEWTVKGSEVHITAYTGAGGVCAVPEHIGGKKVTRICRGAFRGADVECVILPPSIFAVEREAFSLCALRELVIYDTLYYVYDESFSGCANLNTLRINAAVSPAYSGTYFDTFSDKYDRLLSIADEKKIVLFSGSSARFGYDSAAIEAAFEEYRVVNMGVYAYTNALPQLDLIRALMNEGDILLSAPEFDTVGNQFCTTDRLDEHFFAMIESNYDVLTELDIGAYSGVFEALGKHLTVRTSMGTGDYTISPNGYDDDGNAYPFDTYNEYGDLILPREGNDRDVILKWGRADYTMGAFPEETIESLNRVYRTFMEKGVRVYFSYTPRNRSALSEESTKEVRGALHEHLKAHLCVPVISEIEDYLYPGTDFYLIDSHLSTEGVKKRTSQIIRDLSAQLTQEGE